MLMAITSLRLYLRYIFITVNIDFSLISFIRFSCLIHVFKILVFTHFFIFSGHCIAIDIDSFIFIIFITIIIIIDMLPLLPLRFRWYAIDYIAIDISHFDILFFAFTIYYFMLIIDASSGFFHYHFHYISVSMPPRFIWLRHCHYFPPLLLLSFISFSFHFSRLVSLFSLHYIFFFCSHFIIAYGYFHFITISLVLYFHYWLPLLH